MKLSVRPTPTSWRLAFIGLGLLAAAINTGNNLLYLLLGLLLAAGPLAWLGTRLNLWALDVEVRPPPHPRAGSPFTIEVVLHHRGRFDARGIELCVTGVEGGYGPVWVEHLPAGSTVQLRLTGRHSRRGTLRIAGVRLRSIYPLGLLSRTRFVAEESEMLVLPAGAVSTETPARPLPLTGTALQSARVPGHEFEGIRRGSEQDDIRRIDWKSTARRGELMLRETSGESRSRLELRLATRCEGTPQRARARFEAEVSRFASAAQRQLECGGEVRLWVDGDPAERFESARDVVPFLSRLARIEPIDPRGGPLPRPPERHPSTAAPFDDRAARSSPPGEAHRASARLALAISLVALWAFGGTGLASLLGFGLALCFAWWAPERAAVRPGGVMHYAWRVAAFAALGGFLAELFVMRNLLHASIHLVLFITLYVIFNSQSAREDRTSLLVSFMHIVLASALTTEATFALFLIGWLLAVVHAQHGWTSLPDSRIGDWHRLWFAAGSGGPRYAKATAGMVAALVAAGFALFMIVPHVGTGTFSPAGQARQSVSGFSDSARLGDIGRIKRDGSPVMQVELETPIPGGLDLKWRGAALERFDGRTWNLDQGQVEWARSSGDGRFRWDRERAPQDAGATLVQHVRLEPDNAGVLFAAERSDEVVSHDLPYLLRDEGGALHTRIKPGRTARYTVVSRPSTADPDTLRRVSGEDPPRVVRRNLTLPALDPRVSALARELTAGAPSRYDAAAAIEAWLSTERDYTLDVRDARLEDPLASFLFDGMAGHCEYFATAMVVLARSAEIPARFVTGYLRGEKSRFSSRFLVRQSDAHAWVEVYLPQAGWIAFDPTPAAGRAVSEPTGLGDLLSDLKSTINRWWDDYLIGVDLDDQYRRLETLALGIAALAGWVRPALGIVVALAALTALGWALRGLVPGRFSTPRARREAGRPPPAFYRQLLERLARRGLERRPHETAAELALRATSGLPEIEATRVRQLTELYHRVRFDPRTSEHEVRRLARVLLAELP